MAVNSAEPLRGELVSLAHRGHDVRDFALGAARIVGRAVPFDGVCVLTLDPATLLPTGGVVENGLPPAAMARLAEIEMSQNDFNSFSALARAKRPAAGLHEATGGHLDRSVRHREVRRPNGFGDELRAALVGNSATWGAITLLREAGRAEFTPAESELLAALSADIAKGLRRAIVQGVLSAAAPDPAQPVGVVVLEPDHSIAHANQAAEAWLEELREDDPLSNGLPDVVLAVASRARVAADGDTLSEARARVRTPSGIWLLAHGSMLGQGADARSAVILEPARPPELAPLVAHAYGLTERERAVTQLVAQGLDTSAMADRLKLSAWTVQDHLKAIFDKTGTGTRGELVARLFFDLYAPRLAGTDASVRGL